MSLSSSGNDIHSRSYLFEVSDITQVGEVRRFTANLADELGIEEVRRGRLAIIVNELGNNLLQHAKQGYLIARSLTSWSNSDEALRGVEIMSIDRGPGIADLSLSLRDGYSTGSTPGTGLGAVRRQADLFDMHTNMDRGTCTLATVYHQAAPKNRKELLEVGAICIPLSTETVAGDAWCVMQNNESIDVLVVDGLGHGVFAHEAAVHAIDTFESSVTSGTSTPDQLMMALHGRLRTTRGAAVFAVHAQAESGKLLCTGVGNIRGQIWTEGVCRGLISQSGTAGLQLKRTVPVTHDFAKGSVLVLSSDGINTRWSLNDYPGLALRHPSVIAGVIWRDHSRGNDDATILVGRRT